MLPRPVHLAQLLQRLGQFPVVALFGARQVGKTTLARQLAASWDGPVKHFDLEDPDDQARLSDPAFALRPLTGLVVLDEIQTRPDLFPLLRVLADRPKTPARFLILGSASPELLRRAAESLAGRVTFQEMDGFGLDELAAASRLGAPRPQLARQPLAARWLPACIAGQRPADQPRMARRLHSHLSGT